MHRGSSKGTRPPVRVSEALPLSASQRPRRIVVTLEITRAGSVDRRRVLIAPGSSIREALAAAGTPPEGSAVLREGVPQPLDATIDRSVRLTVIPTFSGG